MVKVTLKNSAILFFIFLASSCGFLTGQDEQLTLHCEDLTTNHLRTDGYYYTGTIGPGETVTVYFLYRNGTLCSSGSYHGEEFGEKILKASSPDAVAFRKKFKDAWGVFQVNGDSIVFEKWDPGSGQQYLVNRRLGVILNDSTFMIEKIVGSDGPIRDFHKEIYHFQPFKHKPDSTNDFVCL